MKDEGRARAALLQYEYIIQYTECPVAERDYCQQTLRNPRTCTYRSRDYFDVENVSCCSTCSEVWTASKNPRSRSGVASIGRTGWSTLVAIATSLLSAVVTTDNMGKGISYKGSACGATFWLVCVEFIVDQLYKVHRYFRRITSFQMWSR